MRLCGQLVRMKLIESLDDKAKYEVKDDRKLLSYDRGLPDLFPHLSTSNHHASKWLQWRLIGFIRPIERPCLSHSLLPQSRIIPPQPTTAGKPSH